MTSARIYEDNAGGIHIVTADDRSIYTDQPAPGMLLADIATADDWIDDSRSERPDDADACDWDGECFGEYGARLIAECSSDGQITLYTEAIGASGRRYAGLTNL